MTITMYDMHRIKENTKKSVRGVTLGLAGLLAVACGGDGRKLETLPVERVVVENGRTVLSSNVAVKTEDGVILPGVYGNDCQYNGTIKFGDRADPMDKPDLVITADLKLVTPECEGKAPYTVKVRFKGEGSAKGSPLDLEPGKAHWIQMEYSAPWYKNNPGCGGSAQNSWYRDDCEPAQKTSARDLAFAAVQNALYVARSNRTLEQRAAAQQTAQK